MKFYTPKIRQENHGQYHTPSGDEDYYNNYQYIQGWSYKGIGIGNPFISSRDYTREGLPSDPDEYFINNRVVVFHFGFEGSLQNWEFHFKNFLFTELWNLYKQVHDVKIPGYGIFGEKKQFSAYLDVNKELKQGVNIGFTGAFDVGELFYNSVGVLVRVSKSF